MDSDSEPAALETSHSNEFVKVAPRNPRNSRKVVSDPYAPDHTYASLIAVAIELSPEKRLLLDDIYKFIEQNLHLLSVEHDNWKNSVRHNLSLRKCFKKVPRYGQSGKSLCSYWELDKSCLPKAARQAMMSLASQIQGHNATTNANFSIDTSSLNSAFCSVNDDSSEEPGPTTASRFLDALQSSSQNLTRQTAAPARTFAQLLQAVNPNPSSAGLPVPAVGSQPLPSYPAGFPSPAFATVMHPSLLQSQLALGQMPPGQSPMMWYAPHLALSQSMPSVLSMLPTQPFQMGQVPQFPQFPQFPQMFLSSQPQFAAPIKFEVPSASNVPSLLPITSPSLLPTPLPSSLLGLSTPAVLAPTASDESIKEEE